MREFQRGVNESLIIDHHFEVKVLEIQPDHVRLAITSPHETPSYREETIYLEDPDVGSDLELAELLHP
jgi:carbon storage regulator CsrA